MTDMNSKPRNLIILCVDEMRGDCLGANGLNPDIHTPNMDAVAARGVNLSRHFTCFPKCVPARISMTTGRYTHTDGYRTIWQHMPVDQPNVLKTLVGLHYETAVLGLNHAWENLHEASHTPPELKPGQRGLRIDHHSWTRPLKAIYEDYKSRAPDLTGAAALVDTDLPLTPQTRYRGDLDVHWDSEAITEQAVQLLTRVRDRSRPLFMQVNLGPPHPPYAAPEPWFSMYDPGKIAAFPHDLPAHAPLSLRKQREFRTGMNPDGHLLRKMQAVYYGMISRVDAQMGRILQTIQQQGLWDNSIILLLSDHGDFAGQYGLGEKWDTTFADCLTHVPCVLAGGGLPQGKTISALTDHTDLAPTLLGLLGLQPDWLVHGHDLRPLLEGRVERIREAVFADGGHEAEMRGRFSFPGADSGKQRTYRNCPDAMARAKMVRTDRYKLVMRETGDHELYDLQTDRWELSNRYHDPALGPVRADLMEKMLQWCLRTDTDRPYQQLVGA